MPGFLRVAPSVDANTELPMPDLRSINLYLQERLEREWSEEVSAVEAAGWLDEAGLLRDHKNGLPLRNLLRAGRIAGQEQRPNQPNGRWWIRRLAASPDLHERTRARHRIVKCLPIDRDVLPTDWPLHQGEPTFWEELGKTVAAFGYLEHALTMACYTLTATPEKATSARADGDEAVSKWFARLERSWTDSMNALTLEIDRTLKEDSRVPHGVREDLVERLNDLRPWRNALCHGAWLGFGKDGSGVLCHYYKSDGIPVNFRPAVSLRDLADLRARIADTTIRLAEVASLAGAGFALTTLPRKCKSHQPAPN